MAVVGINYPKALSYAISSAEFNQIIEAIVNGTRGITSSGLAFTKKTIATPAAGRTSLTFDGFQLVEVQPSGVKEIINGARVDTTNTILEQKFWNPTWLADYAGFVPVTQSIGTTYRFKGKYGTASLVTTIDANHEVFGIGVILADQTSEPSQASLLTAFGNIDESTRDNLISVGLVMDATNIKTYNNTTVNGDASYTTVTTIPTFPFDFEMILTLTSESSLRVQVFVNGTSRLNVTINPGVQNLYPMILTNTLSALVNTAHISEAI